MSKSIFKFISNIGKPDLLSMKVNELLEAEVNLLKSQSALEYTQSMVAYNTGRVKRLKIDIQNHVKTIADAKNSSNANDDSKIEKQVNLGLVLVKESE